MIVLGGNAPHFIISLCLTPDDFTRQGESAAIQWVKLSLPILTIILMANIFSLRSKITWHLYSIRVKVTKWGCIASL
jgi:hypothetical protein